MPFRPLVARMLTICWLFLVPGVHRSFFLLYLLQPHKTKKKTKASLGGGKASKKVDMEAFDYDNDLGAEYDDFM